MHMRVKFVRAIHDLCWKWVKIRAPCDQTFRDGLDLTCSQFQGLNFDDFPFFGTSVALLEAELAPFKDWEEIGNI